MKAARFAFVVAALALAPAARAIDAHTPADTQIYVAVNVREAFDSEFFKDNLKDPARELLKQLGGAEKALEELGLDPFRDIDRLVLASPGTKEVDRGLIVAYGSFSEIKFQKRIDRLKKESDGGVKIHDVVLGGGARHAIYEVALPGTETGAFVALKDGKTLFVSPGKDYVVDALKAARAGAKPALASKEVQALIERLEVGKQVLTVALPGRALAAADGVVPGAGDVFGGIDAVGGGLTVGKELRFDLAITAKTEENANQIRSAMDKGVKLATAALALVGEDRKEFVLLYEVVKSVKVIGKGKVLGVSARMTAETLQDLFGKGG